MFQPVQIETQSEQESLAHLRAQRSTRCTGRKFSFHRREQTLDQGTTAVNPLRECAPHLGAHSVQVPGFLSAFGGNYALRSKALGAAVFARDDARAAQRTCSPRLAPNRWRPRRRELASAAGAANRATGAPFRRLRDRWSGRRDAARNDTGP